MTEHLGVNRLFPSQMTGDPQPASEREAAAENQSEPDPRAAKLQYSDLLSRLSISQMTTKRWTSRRDIEACRELGLRFIGLWRLKYEEYGEDNTAALLSEHGVQPSSLSWIGGYTGANGYLLDDTLEESIEVIQYAHWVGARNVVVATGEQGQHILSHATRLTVQSLQMLGDFAEQKGVHLAVMPMSPAAAHGWTFLNSLRKTEELLSACDHPHVGLCLNSYHLLQNPHWKQELTSVLPFIKLVRLCDGKSEKRPKAQCLPLQGRMPILPLMRYLEQSGYRGLYEIDTWTDEIWRTEQIDPFRQCVDELTARFADPSGV